VLDLCVFNTTGESRILIDSDCPENVLPAWKPKFEAIKRFADSILRRYEGFGLNKVKDNLALAFMKSEAPKQFPLITSNTALFKASMSFAAGQRSLSFNCKRVLRLHRPRALAVSLEYMQCLTRPAFERDLGD